MDSARLERADRACPPRRRNQTQEPHCVADPPRRAVWWSRAALRRHAMAAPRVRAPRAPRSLLFWGDIQGTKAHSSSIAPLYHITYHTCEYTLRAHPMCTMASEGLTGPRSPNRGLTAARPRRPQTRHDGSTQRTHTAPSRCTVRPFPSTTAHNSPPRAQHGRAGSAEPRPRVEAEGRPGLGLGLGWAESGSSVAGARERGRPARRIFNMPALGRRSTQRIATCGVAASICNDHSSMVARLA